MVSLLIRAQYHSVLLVLTMHWNRSMKVSGGLVGITLNQSARTRFFLAAPKLAGLAEEARRMAGLDEVATTYHH